MKKQVTFILTLLFFTMMEAQVKIPRASQLSEIKQLIGYTEVRIEYSRPAKKGRKIFGDLVPYGEIWRTGADKNTIVSVSEDIQIDGKILPKGKYALYAEPNSDLWTIYFYKNTDSWGTPEVWNASDIVLQIKAKPSKYPIDTEFFTMEITPVGIANGSIDLRWEQTAVSIPFHTFTMEQVLENIAKNLNENATAFDYYDAALFLLNAERDYKQALVYIDKSMEKQGEKPHYSLWLKARILHKLGQKKEAIKHSEASLEKAKAIGNQSYIRMNEKLLSEWKK